MPRIGEEVRGRKLGYNNGHKYIWSACSICGKERWVALYSKGRPTHLKCSSCAKKGKNSPTWKGGLFKDQKKYDAQYYEENRKWILKRKYPHRYIMEEILGRQLKEEERVHHIDMVHLNNDPENLFVYGNISRHQIGHHSLNKLVCSLLKDNIIEFIDGRYYRK